MVGLRRHFSGAGVGRCYAERVEYWEGMDDFDPDGPKWPWPRIVDGAYEAGTRMDAAAPVDRERIFLELEAWLSPDIVEWDKFLRGTRARLPDFAIPARYDDWKLGREMRIRTEAAGELG
jgi:hypothetical protein